MSRSLMRGIKISGEGELEEWRTVGGGWLFEGTLGLPVRKEMGQRKGHVNPRQRDPVPLATSFGPGYPG